MQIINPLKCIIFQFRSNWFFLYLFKRITLLWDIKPNLLKYAQLCNTLEYQKFTFTKSYKNNNNKMDSIMKCNGMRAYLGKGVPNTAVFFNHFSRTHDLDYSVHGVKYLNVTFRWKATHRTFKTCGWYRAIAYRWIAVGTTHDLPAICLCESRNDSDWECKSNGFDVFCYVRKVCALCVEGKWIVYTSSNAWLVSPHITWIILCSNSCGWIK